MATEPNSRIAAYQQVLTEICFDGRRVKHNGVYFMQKSDTFRILAMPEFAGRHCDLDQYLWSFNTLFTKAGYNRLFLCGATIDCAVDVIDCGPVELFRTGDQLLQHCAGLLSDFILTDRGHRPLLVIRPDSVPREYEPAEAPHNVYVNRKSKSGWLETALQVTNDVHRLTAEDIFKLVDDKLHMHVCGKLRGTPYVV